MTSLDFEEIRRVTLFALKKYHLRLPAGMSPSDFVHEVQVFMFLYCKLDKPRATAIIKNVIWTRNYLLRKSHQPPSEIIDIPSVGDFKAIDDLDEVQEIMDLPFNDYDRKIMNCLASGLDNSETYTKLGLSRQRYHQYKSTLFEKIRLATM